MKPVLFIRRVAAVICLSVFFSCSAQMVNEPLDSSLEKPESSSGKKIEEQTMKSADQGNKDPKSILNNPSQTTDDSKSEFDSFIPPNEGKEVSKLAKLPSFESTDELSDIYFEFDQFGLSSLAMDVLRKNSVWLKKHPSVIVQLEGYCDPRGTNNYNLALGNRRVEKTRELLVALGVERDRVSTISYGEEKPVCINNEESCWSKNRRVHFVIAENK